MGEKGILLHCWWECKFIQLPWRTVWKLLKTLGIKLPYDPEIPLLGIHPEKTIIGKDICAPMFIVALCTIATMLKQLRYPLTDEWKKKMSYKYTMEYSVQFSRSVVFDSLRPMNRSSPGLPVHHQLMEFTHTHVQPSHPLSSPSPPAPNPSQHQGLFQ